MPQGDRTGPMGQGSRTGRSLGFCSGHDTPGYTRGLGERMQRGSGFGRGMGLGRRMGQGRNSGNSPSGFSGDLNRMSSIKKEDEISLLKSQIDVLKHSQQTLEKRLEDLANDKG